MYLDLKPNEWGDLIAGLASALTLIIVIFQGVFAWKRALNSSSISQFSILINQKVAVVQTIEITERNITYKGLAAIVFILENNIRLESYQSEIEQLMACFDVIEKHLEALPRKSLPYCQSLFDSTTSQKEREIIQEYKSLNT